MRASRALAVGLSVVLGVAGLGMMSGAGATGTSEGDLSATLPTYTGTYEMYATIALVPMEHFEYQAILKPGRPPVHLDVRGVAGRLDRFLGKKVQATGRYQWGTNQQGERVRYMVAQRIRRVN